MNRMERLIQAIKGAQAVAGALISEAAKDGDFDAAAELAARGRDLSELMHRWVDGNDEGTPHEDRAQLATLAAPIDRVNRRASGSTEPVQNIAAEYPRFFREGDELVKLGWSPTAQTTYEHRAAKTVVDLIVKRVIAMGENGHRFSMDKLLHGSAKNSARSAHPSYQVYAVVAWLKWCGLLIQHGRQGYTVANPKAFAESSATAWNALQQR